MKVLVVGGTGFIGTRLCRELADRGHDVTALSRSASEGDVPDDVSTARGSVTDYHVIEDAFDGQDAVVNLVALSPLYVPGGGEKMHERVHLRGTENCVRAAEEHGVDRFVQMSGLGVSPDGPTHFLRAKGRAEAVVRDSALDWVVVRPSTVFGDGGEFIPFTRKLTTPVVAALPGGGRTRFQPIFVEDLVSMLADVLEGDEHVGRTYELGGPDVVTLADVARMAYRANGRSLSVVPVPMALAGIGLSLAGIVPGIPFGRDQYRSLRLDHTVPDNDVGTFGFSDGDLTTMAEYLGIESSEEIAG